MISIRRPAMATSRAARDQPDASRPTVAGDGLLHPVVLASIAVLIANDHVLKAAAPGWLTGKLSDVAGLVFFPLLVVAGWELLRAMLGRRTDPSARSVIVAVIVTGLAFAAIKTTDVGASLFSRGLGIAQWLAGSAWSVVAAIPPPAIQRAQVVRDPTDLVALLALLIAAAIGLARSGRSVKVSRRVAGSGPASGSSW